MVTLLSPDGTVLDTSSIAVPKAEPVAETPVAPIESKNNTLMYVTILALTIALITILFVATRHKKEVVVEEVAKTE
jgi:choline kinase